MQRIRYYDSLRFLAIFGVIALHVFQSWPNAAIGNMELSGFSEIFKFAVPVFLMISGALLLKREMPINEFLKRRFARLTYPFILYLIIYVAVLFAIMSTVPGFESLSTWFGHIPLHYNWYFWTIAGLYLTIPILSKFINHSTFREIEYFLVVLLAGCVIYQLTLGFKTTIFLNLNFFVSPVAYLIIGYYLANKDFGMSANRMVSIALILFIGATLLKMAGQFHLIPMPLVEDYVAARSKIIASYVDMGVLQIVQASALFVMMRFIYESKSGIYSKVNGFLNGNLINRFILSVSMASYGMYLFHHTLIEPFGVLIQKFTLSGSQIACLIAVCSVIIFMICWIVVLLVSRIPLIGKYSGYH